MFIGLTINDSQLTKSTNDIKWKNVITVSKPLFLFPDTIHIPIQEYCILPLGGRVYTEKFQTASSSFIHSAASSGFPSNSATKVFWKKTNSRGFELQGESHFLWKRKSETTDLIHYGPRFPALGMNTDHNNSKHGHVSRSVRKKHTHTHTHTHIHTHTHTHCLHLLIYQKN